jgi:hypothetical protein
VLTPQNVRCDSSGLHLTDNGINDGEVTFNNPYANLPSTGQHFRLKFSLSNFIQGCFYVYPHLPADTQPESPQWIFYEVCQTGEIDWGYQSGGEKLQTSMSLPADQSWIITYNTAGCSLTLNG